MVSFNVLAQHWVAVGKGLLTELSGAIKNTLVPLETWIGAAGQRSAKWLASQELAANANLSQTIQNLKSAASQQVGSWDSWLDQQSTAFNNTETTAIDTAGGNIKTWNDWTASETTRLEQWLSDQITGFDQTRDQGIASWNGWISGEENQINGMITSWSNWIAGEINRLNNWLQNEINNITSSASNPAGAVQSGIDSLDGGKWESYVGIGLVDDPIGTLRSTVAAIIASEQDQANQAIAGYTQQLSQEQAQTAQAIAGLQSVCDQSINNASSSASSVLSGEIDQANQAIDTIKSQLSQALTNATNTLTQAQTQASQAIQAINNTLQQATTSASNAVAGQIAKLETLATSAGKQIAGITAGLETQAVTQIATAVVQTTNGNYVAAASAVVNSIIQNANTKVTALFPTS